MEQFEEKWPQAKWLAPNRVASLEDVDGVAGVLDGLVFRIGRIVAWLTLFLVLLVAADVLLRYLFRISSVAAQELEWHILAVIALFGASYTLQQGEHVRVDVFYQHFSPKVKQWMDALLPAIVVVPCMTFIAFQSLQFVQMSWEFFESSPDPGGLPARYLLKVLVPIGFLLVAIQGVAMTLYGFTKIIKAEK